MSELDGRGLWLNSLLLDVSPPSVCNIFRGDLLNPILRRDLISGFPGVNVKFYGLSCVNSMIKWSRRRGHLSSTLSEGIQFRVYCIINANPVKLT